MIFAACCVTLVIKFFFAEKSLQTDISSGTIRFRNSANEVRVFEFLTSTFGGSLPTEPFPVHVADPFDACRCVRHENSFEARMSNYFGSSVVVVS
jgi:hypothetical protein